MSIKQEHKVWAILDTFNVYGNERVEAEKQINELIKLKDKEISSLKNRLAKLRKDTCKK